MSKLRRYFSELDYVFITSVTYNRMKILCEQSDLLLDAFIRSKKIYSFDMIAWVILDDHFHFVISGMGANFPDFIHRIKQVFSANYRSRMNLKRGRVWQNRYWDHIIRNQEDLNQHLDYIHYNPVKHNYVDSPHKYKLSTFNFYCDGGFYQKGWGEHKKIEFKEDYGE